MDDQKQHDPEHVLLQVVVEALSPVQLLNDFRADSVEGVLRK